MPVALIIFGALLIASGVHGKTREFFSQLKEDGTNFASWFLVLMIVLISRESGTLRPVANAFLALIIIAFALGSGKQIVGGFNDALNYLRNGK